MTKRVCEGRISSSFGMRHDPINRLVREHNGVDIAAAKGTPVLSPTDGSVTAIYSNPMGGNTLIIHSTSGEYRFGFCHLNYYGVKVGDTVSKGDLVARTGNTGRTTGPHLHFTVMRDGKYIDPEPFLEL